MDLPTHVCRRALRPPRLDGTVTDPEWTRCDPLKLVLTTTGETPRYATTARLLWDEGFLYVAFVCEDPDIWGTLTQRDDPLYKEEVVEVFLDEDADESDYYEFEVSPRNVVIDLLVEWRGARMWADPKWNCAGWRTAVHVEGTLDNRHDTDTRWSVEMAIPWAALANLPRRRLRAGDRMRLNLYRIDRAKDGDEYSAWSPTLGKSFHRPARFGHLVLGE
ncbi:MAG: carbohydrate-binding family 9-like protein [Armatimonadota bacterium]|nr:carbohydrate-binding family 9-like protein [Armatimonadota bacterium]